MKFTFIYLISTIECMYIVNSFDIGAVSEAEAQKCSYQGPYLNFFSWGPRPPQPPRLALQAPPPWKFTFLRPCYLGD